MSDLPSASRDRLAAYASRFGYVALANITRPYPCQPGHVLQASSSLVEPRQLHPAFYGSYDWHSAVHMHWLLITLLRHYPSMPDAALIRMQLSRHFTVENIAQEALYFRHSGNRAFERTYGWAWLLALQATLIAGASRDPAVDEWRQAVQPLAELIARRYLEFLPMTHFPVRAGTHGNSAFGLLLALRYAHAAEDAALANVVRTKASDWFANDRRYPAHYEPGGDDFLSGGLIEAALMRHALADEAFLQWWNDFCPDSSAMQTWLRPVSVSDRSDPKLAHLDGLNLSRAWCWSMLRPVLPGSLRQAAEAAIDRHLAASLPAAVNGDYAGTHWLASFARLALVGI